MKTSANFFLLFLFPVLAFAQTQIAAKDIIDQINGGKAVSYQNAEVVGDLDLTQLQNRRLKKEVSRGWSGSQRNYVSTVESSLQFTNCTFRGDVLAYYSKEGENATYHADFARAVRFENCTFERESAFKYSRFEREVSFRGSRFRENALFKYTEFSDSPDFSDAKFSDGADFKYVKFPRDANFSGATFEREAVFKYTKFSAGANFERATFASFADFKYTEFSGSPQLSGIAFWGSENFKYAKVDGRSFATYLLKNR